MSLTSIITKTDLISVAEREQMFQLHGRYFSNTHWDMFSRDLNEKDWAIILKDGVNLAGFSTLQLLRIPERDGEKVFLYSGDTVVDPSHWHESTLAGSFGHFMLRLIDENQNVPLYWFLITKGFRTYRFLPVYFNCFYPAYDRPTPPEYVKLIQAVARTKFNGSFDAEKGLIRFGGQRERLTLEMGGIPPGRMQDPHVRFFLEKNPDYLMGDELACIAAISKQNLNRYAWRVIGNTRVQWVE